jgi:hypothetical protein
MEHGGNPASSLLPGHPVQGEADESTSEHIHTQPQSNQKTAWGRWRRLPTPHWVWEESGGWKAASRAKKEFHQTCPVVLMALSQAMAAI